VGEALAGQGRRDVVLGVTGGEQHQRHGDHVAAAPPDEVVHRLGDRRPRQLDETRRHVEVGRQDADALGEVEELGGAVGGPGPVSGDQKARRSGHAAPRVSW
jgi:hypothetical protein